MDSKMAALEHSQEEGIAPDIPAANPDPRQDRKPASYSMMEPRMRCIYGEFNREIYFTEKKHLDTKTQELISIAATLAAKCQGCIEGHLKKAIQAGATREEISKTICIAAAVNAAAIVDLTDIAATRLDLNHFSNDGLLFRV